MGDSVCIVLSCMLSWITISLTDFILFVVLVCNSTEHSKYISILFQPENQYLVETSQLLFTRNSYPLNAYSGSLSPFIALLLVIEYNAFRDNINSSFNSSSKRLVLEVQPYTAMPCLPYSSKRAYCTVFALSRLLDFCIWLRR